MIMNKLEKLKMIMVVNDIYSDYLYDSDDKRPLNKLLVKYGLPPIGEMKLKLKDKLEEGWGDCEGNTYTVHNIYSGHDYNISLKDVDGEFDISHIEEII
jgi:hypothetical protein